MKYVIKTGSKLTCYHIESNGKFFLTSTINSALKYDSKSKAEKKLKQLQKIHPERKYTLKEIINTTNII